jgi:hypothetical protein
MTTALNQSETRKLRYLVQSLTCREATSVYTPPTSGSPLRHVTGPFSVSPVPVLAGGVAHRVLDTGHR